MNYRDLGFSVFMMKPLATGDTYSSTNSGGGSYASSGGVGSISSNELSVQLNPVTDISFSSTDYNTAAWTAGTIFFSNGSNSGNIVAGNTGDITDKTYVYFDGDKPTQLLMDTDIKNVFGGRKILLAVVEVGEAGKACKIIPTISTGFSMNITAGQIMADSITTNEIATNSITANEIAAGAVTSDKISVTQLDAVTANTGTLTVDEYITVGDSKIKIDGANKRILVNDGTNDRVLIGLFP